MRYRVRRVTAREDLVVLEVSASYDGGPWMYGVQLLEFQDDKAARERIYVMDGWEAPEWRAPLARGHSCGRAGVKHYLALEVSRDCDRAGSLLWMGTTPD